MNQNIGKSKYFSKQVARKIKDRFAEVAGYAVCIVGLWRHIKENIKN